MHFITSMSPMPSLICRLQLVFRVRSSMSYFFLPLSLLPRLVLFLLDFSFCSFPFSLYFVFFLFVSFIFLSFLFFVFFPD